MFRQQAQRTQAAARTHGGRTQQQQQQQQHASFSATQPIPIDVHQSVVIGGNELNHIYRLASLDDSSVNEAALRRSEARERSQQRYQQWGNTLEAHRERKKTDRAQRLANIEAQAQQIDAEESVFLEAQRRTVLDRANRLLWQDTDKVKNFHGGLLLASVLKEREAQLDLAKAKASQRRRIDQTFHDAAEEDRLKAIHMAALEEEKRLDARKSAAREQLAQLKEVRVRQNIERTEQVEEGERIKRVAAEARREAAEEEIARQERMWSYNQEYLRANAEQLQLKHDREEADRAVDGKIAAFAAEKERLTQLRREHEGARKAAKQKKVDKMLLDQFNHLKNLKEEESKRTDQQVKEIEKRTDDRFAEEARKRAELKEATRLSRKAQVDRKNAELARQRAIDDVLTREWKHRNLEMQAAEWDEHARTLEVNLRLQETLREQMTGKEEKQRAEVQKEYEEAQMMREAREREDRVFDAYCSATFGELQLKGKSTVPLQLTLHNDRMKSQRPGNYAQQNFRQ